MKRLQSTGKALGSEIFFTIVVDENQEADQIFKILWARTTAFEDRFSRFKTESETTKVNMAAGSKVKVSEEFIALTESAIHYSKITAGLYNPLLLPALQTAGYKGSWPEPDIVNKNLDYSLRKSNNTKILIDKATQEVQIPKDTAIDFGGIGKGYLLDELAHLLDTKHVKDYWLSLGGDIICSGYDLDNTNWRISISSANNPGESYKIIENKKAKKLAIATSGITKRKGQNWHHIIDPRTGLPAKTDILTATVSSENSVDADVFAKCIVILGKNDADDFAKQHRFEALIQT